jgi:hypothetical protein
VLCFFRRRYEPRCKVAFAAGSNWTAPANDPMLMVSPEPLAARVYDGWGVELATGNVTAEVRHKAYV